MKKIILTAALFVIFSINCFAEEWAISVNGQVIIFSSEHEFQIANIAIAREMRNLCWDGIPIYWAISVGGVDLGKGHISPDISFQCWEVTKNLATDEQLRLAIQEGYWFGIVPEFIPSGTGNFQNLRRGDFRYINISGQHYIIEIKLVARNAPMWNF
jgi:hypothetical protein